MNVRENFGGEKQLRREKHGGEWNLEQIRETVEESEMGGKWNNK